MDALRGNLAPMSSSPVSYWDYINVEQLLGLQRGLSNSESELSNDEVLFITVHQIDELWFKLILRELVSVRDLFAHTEVPEQSLSSAVRGIRRMEVLLHHIAQHFSVLETMTTRDYLSFRDKLTSASGFQSAGLREIEILAGLREADRIPLGKEGSYLTALKNPDGSESPASRRVGARLSDTPTLIEAVRDWLFRTPIEGSDPSLPDDREAVKRFLERYATSFTEAATQARLLAEAHARTPEDRERLRNRYEKEIENARSFLEARDVEEKERFRISRIRAAALFIESYRELPLLAWPREIVDALVSFEQAFVIFRQRHARMVERMIGRRTGTGGSAGVDYLDQTALKYRLFPELWAVRSLLVDRKYLPELEHSEFYGFSSKPPSKR